VAKKSMAGLDDDELPSGVSQARTLARTAVKVAQAAARGESVVTSGAELVRRLKVCVECPRYQRATRRCLDCGCHIRLKARLAATECPQDLW